MNERILLLVVAGLGVFILADHITEALEAQQDNDEKEVSRLAPPMAETFEGGYVHTHPRVSGLTVNDEAAWNEHIHPGIDPRHYPTLLDITFEDMRSLIRAERTILHNTDCNYQTILIAAEGRRSYFRTTYYCMEPIDQNQAYMTILEEVPGSELRTRPFGSVTLDIPHLVPHDEDP